MLGKFVIPPNFSVVCRFFFFLCLAVMIRGKELGFVCGMCEFFMMETVLCIQLSSFHGGPVCRGGTRFPWSLSLAPCICHLRKLGRIVYNFALFTEDLLVVMCKRGRDTRVICTIL